jgi:hypothetical protein
MSEMSKPWRVWRRLVRGRVERAPDPADMGTAFGLDYCLSQCEPLEDGAADVAPADPAGRLCARFMRGALTPR